MFIDRKTATNFGLVFGILTASFFFGMSYGSGNQLHYLLHAFSQIDPHFAQGDWFINSGTDYHYRFSELVVALSSIWNDLPFTLTTAQILINIAIFACVLLICKTINRTKGDLVFAAALLTIISSNIATVGLSSLIPHPLQASTIATALSLFSLLFFIKDKHLLCGLSIAAAGYFHVNFLILIVPGLALSQLIYDKRIQIITLSKIAIPPALVCLYLLPDILAATTGENADAARKIFQEIRAPHHYQPLQFLIEFVPFVTWLALGSLAYRAGEAKEVTKKAMLVSLSFSAIIAIATILTTVVYIPQVSQIFAYRIAPFAMLLMQIIFFTTIATNPKQFRQSNIYRHSITGLAIICISTYFGDTALSLTLFSLFSFLVVTLELHCNPKKRLKPYLAYSRYAAICLLLMMLTISFLTNASYITHRSTSTNLYQWANSTSIRSTFIIPPNILSFKLHARRSTVVDWKAIPVAPDLVLEWKKRVDDTSNGCDVTSREMAIRCFNDMDWTYIKDVGAKYHANYIVIMKNKHKHELPTSSLAFEGEKVAVYEINN